MAAVSWGGHRTNHHAHGVVFVRWPVEVDKRESLRRAGVPRLLILDAGEPAPLCRDALEDWVRPPLSQQDVQTRTRTLEERARLQTVPAVDHDDVLRFSGQVLPLSPIEARLMAVLVENYQEVVARRTLVAQGWPDQTPPRRNALDLHILRLRRRIAAVGLTVRTVWSRGYVLDQDDRPPLP
jgi:hypothetical protein